MPEDDSNYPSAAVLDDPDAVALLRAIEKLNCKSTFDVQVDRVIHFKNRIIERGASPDEVMIVLLNMNDQNGRSLGDHLLPGQDAAWQKMRDLGQTPFARGLVTRKGIEEAIMVLDKEACDKLVSLKGKFAVLVMDYGAVEVFEVP